VTASQPTVVLTARDGTSVRIDGFPVVLGRSHPDSPIQPDCDIGPLDPEGRVSRQHAVIDLRDGHLVVTDLGSPNGTVVDGRRLEPHQSAPRGARARLEFAGVPVELAVEVEQPAPARPPASPGATVLFDPPPPPAAASPRPPEPPPAMAPPRVPEPPPPPPPPPPPVTVAAQPAPGTVDGAVMRILEALADERTTHAALRPDRSVHLRRGGEWTRIEPGADTWPAVWGTVCGLVGIDTRARGHVVARSGALVAEAFLPPTALEPVLIIERRPPFLSLDQMIAAGICSAGPAEALRAAVRARRGILVSGPRESGRTRMLETLVDALPPGDRVVVVERRPQIRLTAPLGVRLASPEGMGEPAVAAALSAAADWMVIDDAEPAALGAPAARAVVSGAVPIWAVRSGAPEASAEAFPVRVRLEHAGQDFRVAAVEG
jgi:hypothetical protein